MEMLFALLTLLCAAVGAQEVLAIPASGLFKGSDGAWSTINLQIGSPAQNVEVLVSTTSQQFWVVHPSGCTTSADPDTCAEARGGVYNPTQSSSWKELSGDSNTPSFFDLYYGEYLKYYGNAQYGYDTVTFGLPGGGLPTLSNTTLGALATLSFYTGFFGLEPKPTNFTDLNENSPSPMQLLKEQGSIPSLSYGFNPGAQYRGIGQSLTLGGYDQARFNPEQTLTYAMTAEPARDLTVAIDSISWNGTRFNLSNTPMSMGIDSTFTQIYLPIELCRQFESAFGLVYNDASLLYLINDTQHTQLLSMNPTFTFALEGPSAGTIINITLPYTAFDLPASPSFNNLTTATRYFPINRANDSSQFVLGRAFLQEAYLSTCFVLPQPGIAPYIITNVYELGVDFERSTFNISAMDWSDLTTNDFIKIDPVTPASSSSSSSSSSGLGGGAIAGIVVGVVAAIAIVAGMFFFYLRRKRAARKAADAEAEAQKKEKDSDSQSDSAAYQKAELEAPVIPIAGEGKGKGPASELDSPSTALSPHAGNSDPVEAGESRQIFEMEGSAPKPLELEQGRNLSEKEQMIFRERMHNGIDPAESNSPRSPRDEDTEPTQ